METFRAIVDFLGSYPGWARLGVGFCVGAAVLIVIIAPRQKPEANAMVSDLGPDERQNDEALTSVAPAAADDPSDAVPLAAGSTVYFRIQGIKVFPKRPGIFVHLTANVNGLVIEYPSVGGVKWMEVGPEMSQKIVQIPRARDYEVSFEMQTKNGSPMGGYDSIELQRAGGQRQRQIRMQSQVATPVTKLPFSEDYKLYAVSNQTRSATVSAIVSYAITESP